MAARRFRRRKENNPLKLTDLFRRRRPSRREVRRQVAAIRARTANARQIAADTDAKLWRTAGKEAQ
jgi:hypothetical protein